MNKNTLRTFAAAVDTDVTTLTAVFAEDMQSGAKNYTFLLTRELAKTLDQGDYVVVETVNGLKTVIVTDIHAHAQVDLNSAINYRWAFQRVDIAALKLVKVEQNLIAKRLEEAQYAQTRKAVLKEFGLKPSDVVAAKHGE